LLGKAARDFGTEEIIVHASHGQAPQVLVHGRIGARPPPETATSGI
jgi:hypothetical protein